MEALLVVRRSVNGSCLSGGCSSWANRFDDECSMVLWPPILISRPFAKVACHASFGLASACVDCLTTTSSCKRPVVPCLTRGIGLQPLIGRERFLGSRINVCVASSFSRSIVSAAADFVTHIGFGRVGTVG